MDYIVALLRNTCIECKAYCECWVGAIDFKVSGNNSNWQCIGRWHGKSIMYPKHVELIAITSFQLNKIGYWGVS